MAAGQTYVNPTPQPKRKIRPKDPKAAIEYDIEEEHEKINKMENKYRTDLESQRKNQQKEIDNVEKKCDTTTFSSNNLLVSSGSPTCVTDIIADDRPEILDETLKLKWRLINVN